MWAVALLSLVGEAFAQDLVRVWGGYQPPSEFVADSEVADLEGPDLRFTSFGGSLLTVPIRLFDRKLTWINGASYAQILPRTSVELPDDVSNDMYSITLDVILLAELTERWQVLALVKPGIQSNLAVPLSDRDFRMQVVGLGSYAVSERTRLGLGFGYANLFGTPQPLPILQVSYEGERVRVDTLLPQKAIVWFEVVDDVFSLGLEARLSGGYFHRGNPDAQVPGDTFIRYSLGVLGPVAEARLGPLRLTGQVGYAFRRTFDIFRDDDPLAQFDLERGLTARASLGIGVGKTKAPNPDAMGL